MLDQAFTFSVYFDIKQRLSPLLSPHGSNDIAPLRVSTLCSYMSCFLPACAFDGGHNGPLLEEAARFGPRKREVWWLLYQQSERKRGIPVHNTDQLAGNPSLYIPLTLISFLRKRSQCVPSPMPTLWRCHPVPCVAVRWGRWADEPTTRPPQPARNIE